MPKPPMTDQQAAMSRRGAEMPMAKRTAAIGNAASRDIVRKLANNPIELNEVFDRIAAGEQIARIARNYGCRYSDLYNYLKNKCPDQLSAARAAHADAKIHQSLSDADRVSKGLMDPTAARTAAGIRQWYAERVDQDRWGQRSSVNVHHTGVVSMHVEAIRAINGFDGAGTDDVEDAEYTVTEESEQQGEDAPPVDVENHPLL